MARPVVAERWRRSALLCLLFTALAQTATAQGLAGSFEQLQVLVKPGDTVTVVDGTGVETKERQPTSGPQVSVAPWLTGQRKGLLVTLRF